jgi:hypothetical protein
MEKLTQEQVEAVKEFERTMREEVIPEVVRKMEERETAWEKFIQV